MAKIITDQKKIPSSNLFNQKKMTDAEAKAKMEEWSKALKGKPVTLKSSDTKKNLEKEAKQSKISIFAIPENKKNTPAEKNGSKCSNFCRSKGFNILPLRYSVIAKNSHPLPNTLGKNVKEISLSKFHYTVEMMNMGYIYCLTKRAKSGFKGNWAGYKVTPKGYLSYFVVGKNKTAPVNVDEFACNNSGHQFAGSVITIEERSADPALEVFIIYTHSPISDEKRDEYEKNAENFVAQGRWQKVKISEGSTQEHCFGAKQIQSSIYNLKSFGNNRIKLMKQKFNEFPKAFACMGIYDPIGITRSLNNVRNTLSFNKIKGFLDEKDAQGITNEHKLHTMTTIDGLEQALQRNFISVKQKATDAMGKNNEAGIGVLELELEQAQKSGNYVKADYLKKKIQEKKATWQNNKVKLDQYYEGLGKVKGSEQWQNKYSKLLDMNAYDNFKTKFTRNSSASETIAESYANDHIAWLGSKYLRNGLYIFDTKILVPFGFYYHVLVSDLMKGMSGNKVSYNFLTKWLNKDIVDSENLYLKAYCFNIQDIENKFNEAMNEGKLSDWENSLSIGKGLIGAFTAADAAWENWVNNPQLNSSLSSLQGTKTGFAFHWLSESMKYVIDRTPKMRISGKYPTEFARWLFILRARTGPLAERFGINSYFYRIDYQIWRASNNSNLSQQSRNTARQWLDRRLNDAIDDVTARTNSNSNRIAAIVTFFEFLNFAMQREKNNEEGKKDFEFVSQYNAATMTLLAASLDMTGSWFENSRWNVTGGLKAAGAVFATIGGTLGAYLDYQSLNNEFNPIGRVIIYLKVGIGSASLIAGGYLAMVYVSKALIARTNSELFRKIAQKIIVEKIVTFALVWIGRFNILGIGITAAEIFLRKFFFDNSLEKWCKQCSFRTKINNSESLFKDVMAETKAFEMAIGSNLG